MVMNPKSKPIAQKVREYLRNKPYILKALEADIVSLTRLSRKIRTELRIGGKAKKRENAIKAALRRHSEKLRKEAERREKRALNVLKGSNVRLRNGVNVVILSKPLEAKSMSTIMSLNYKGTYVYVLEKNARIPKDAIDVHRDCGVLEIRSPPAVEKAPGVVAYLTSVVAEQNINVLEFISCHTKTVLLIEKGDGSRAYDVLSKVVG